VKRQNILIIRFSSIGDIVLTTPVIRCIHQQKPDADIYLLTKEKFSGVLKDNPYLKGIISYRDDIHETIGVLRAIGIDVIVDLHYNQRSLLVKLAFPFTSTFTFHKLNFEKWLMVNFKKNILPDKHITDRYFDSLKSFGIENDGRGLDFFIDENETYDVKQLPPTFQNGYVVFSIGGNHATKKLPEEKWRELAERIRLPVIVLGGKDEMQAGDSIAFNQDKVLNLCGKTKLHQSASVIQQSNIVVTHDTGLMHITAALKKPMIAVCGNTIPEFGMMPYYGKHDVWHVNAEVKNLHCRPCSKLGYQECPKGHFKCMQQQDINSMVLAIHNMLRT
jgi:ADP-heptose:LPS heptosyltransferase